MPFGLELPGNVNVGTKFYVESFIDGHTPFVKIKTKISAFGGLTGVKLTGDFWLGKKPDANDFDLIFNGYAGFGQAMPDFSISGYADRNTQSFSGEMEYGFGAKGWSAKVTVMADFTLEKGKPDIELDAKGKACVAGKCDRVGASAEIESDGRLRVCANVPGFGKKCDKI